MGSSSPHRSSSSLTRSSGRFGGHVVFSAPNFRKRGFHDSLTHTSIVLFCVDARAVCERWCRWASFEPLSFLFSARGRRNSFAFRPHRPTSTPLLSRSLL